jgi:hypothetical protein
MKNIKRSGWAAAMSLLTITVVFLGEISPWQGLGIITFFVLLVGIILWATGLILLIKEISIKQKENDQKKGVLISTVLIISFIPISILYVGISEYINTKITVDVINRSPYKATNILIYGAGNIFDDSDTLKVKTFNSGEKIEYITRPSTAPGRKGYIKMEFDVDNKHVSRNIAGEFSINPYSIQQDWNVIVDNKFVK